MKTFKINKEYIARHICDSDTTSSFTVQKRTNKTITLKTDEGDIIRKKIYKYEDTEIVYPLGIYSMCLTLRAN